MQHGVSWGPGVCGRLAVGASSEAIHPLRFGPKATCLKDGGVPAPPPTSPVSYYLPPPAHRPPQHGRRPEYNRHCCSEAANFRCSRWTRPQVNYKYEHYRKGKLALLTSFRPQIPHTRSHYACQTSRRCSSPPPGHQSYRHHVMYVSLQNHSHPSLILFHRSGLNVLLVCIPVSVCVLIYDVVEAAHVSYSGHYTSHFPTRIATTPSSSSVSPPAPIPHIHAQSPLSLIPGHHSPCQGTPSPFQTFRPFLTII